MWGCTDLIDRVESGKDTLQDYNVLLGVIENIKQKAIKARDRWLNIFNIIGFAAVIRGYQGLRKDPN